MRKIPPKHREIINSDLYYKTCVRQNEGNCAGNITIEHALIFGGRQIAELWNYIPLCEYHHSVNNYQDGGDLDKEKNTYFALNRATDEELLKYSKALDYLLLRKRLNKKYK